MTMMQSTFQVTVILCYTVEQMDIFKGSYYAIDYTEDNLRTD